MKTNREQLLKELESVIPGLSSKEIIEQSSCFIFDDKHIKTYNDEISCSIKTSLNVKGAVQAQPLIEILRKLKEEEIEINVAKDGAELEITGKKRKAGIVMEKEILLPVDTVEKPKHWNKLNSKFSEAVSLVQNCVGKDETQFMLTCLHIHPDFIEACDNYQVGRFKIKTGITTPTLIRKESIKHIIHFDMTEFSETKSWIHFKNPAGLVISCRRYVEEKYEDVSNILKVKGTTTILPKGLKEAAEKATVFCKDELADNDVTITLNPGKLKIKGQNSQGYFWEVKKIKYSGATMKFSISPELLIEVIKRKNECVINNERLKITDGSFEYVTCLTIAEEKGK